LGPRTFGGPGGKSASGTIGDCKRGRLGLPRGADGGGIQGKNCCPGGALPGNRGVRPTGGEWRIGTRRVGTGSVLFCGTCRLDITISKRPARNGGRDLKKNMGPGGAGFLVPPQTKKRGPSTPPPHNFPYYGTLTGGTGWAAKTRKKKNRQIWRSGPTSALKPNLRMPPGGGARGSPRGIFWTGSGFEKGGTRPTTGPTVGQKRGQQKTCPEPWGARISVVVSLIGRFRKNQSAGGFEGRCDGWEGGGGGGEPRPAGVNGGGRRLTEGYSSRRGRLDDFPQAGVQHKLLAVFGAGGEFWAVSGKGHGPIWVISALGLGQKGLLTAKGGGGGGTRRKKHEKRRGGGVGGGAQFVRCSGTI